MTVSVQEADFDAGAEIAALSRGRDDVGAVASFVGLVRADKATGGTVSAGTQSAGAGDTAAVAAMTLEHYPGMTEKALQGIVAEARGRWDISVSYTHLTLPTKRIV